MALGDVQALQEAARQGAWRAVLEKTRAALAGPGGGFEPSRAAPAVASPAWLALKTYHVLALTKLRTFGGAADELRQLGNLDDPRYNTAPDGSSAVPHALRILAAELPGLLGRPRETADALYALADRCAEETSRAARLAASDPAVASSNPSSGEGGDEGIWRRRRDAAMHAAVNAHVSEGEHLAALARLDWMARCRPANDPDPGIFSLAGRVHLQLGDVEGAEMCFDAARDAASAAASAAAAADARRTAAEISARCETDAGLLAVARKDHAGARRLFEAAVAARPWDAVAANNLAVTHMYTRDLRGGVRVLEESLTCHPAAAAQRECLMRNACSMYEMRRTRPLAAAACRRVDRPRRAGRFRPRVYQTVNRPKPTKHVVARRVSIERRARCERRRREYVYSHTVEGKNKRPPANSNASRFESSFVMPSRRRRRVLSRSPNSPCTPRPPPSHR